jgi:single-stranded DNA-binding protein
MLNESILTGNLGADPEVFYSSEGNPVASFKLAFQSSKTITSNDYEVKASLFFKCKDLLTTGRYFRPPPP